MLTLFYVSISGNTRAFAKRLSAYAEAVHAKDATQPLINAVEYTPSFDPTVLDGPFFAMVPTYLDGGDGINNGYKEVMTLDFRDELADANLDNLLGIIGSGNRNFNAQFGLTAKHYARRFNSPVIGLYELRGNDEEAARIYTTMCKYQADFARRGVKRALVH
ncbi:class Ib ribonucleoside-diphosphate reductase assembly flavoprotein NrdI [Lacticaseibacillus daqingensis]|uniref:class Ib ribonucleoside-diphosphate reductase assembly flavoprotein NrdI n=1 Tax=Lacticaseibacillus daqingensis TaxID=2486014 RepID=UPI000F7AF3C8|nr:class Ib ribonucleoside-diphosphate reductase assembly flavoprotein NrdI [Lacticaseibacillus daqingensis]